MIPSVIHHNSQFVTFAGWCFQAGTAAEGYYVLANKVPTCETGMAVAVTSGNGTTFAMEPDGSVKVIRYQALSHFGESM
jgi:hypothetical protein